jgi:hypothetical protein
MARDLRTFHQLVGSSMCCFDKRRGSRDSLSVLLLCCNIITLLHLAGQGDVGYIDVGWIAVTLTMGHQ